MKVTPEGQSAVTAGQVQPKLEAEVRSKPLRITPVEGSTPEGATAASAPPPTATVAEIELCRRQNVANLALLARQALSQSFETMSVDPKFVADFCDAYERQASSIPSATPGGSIVVQEGALEAAKEAGRKEAIAEFAAEKAELLQQISNLKAEQDVVKTAEVPEEATQGEAPVADAFRGPGHNSDQQ